MVNDNNNNKQGAGVRNNAGKSGSEIELCSTCTMTVLRGCPSNGTCIYRIHGIFYAAFNLTLRKTIKLKTATILGVYTVCTFYVQ